MDAVGRAIECVPTANFGEHAIIEMSEGGYLTFVCYHCTWEMRLPVNHYNIDRKLMTQYAFGDALDTTCEDDRDPEVDVHYDDGTAHVNVGIEPQSMVRRIDTTITVNQD